jgi:hypothetical protein
MDEGHLSHGPETAGFLLLQDEKWTRSKIIHSEEALKAQKARGQAPLKV